MKRRQFIQNFSLLAGGSTFSNYTPFNYKNFGSGSKNILLNAYYFRAHMYTMVPHQIQEDMKTMAAAGTKVISIAILEQDLWAGNHNIQTICIYAAEEGLQVRDVASRRRGLGAGRHIVPRMLSPT